MTSRILVVNDPLIDQQTLDDLSSVFDVTVVSDAKKAISLVRTHHDIDLLVFDTDMRHCDPLHFLQELNAGQGNENIHKVIVTDFKGNYDGIVENVERSKQGTVDFLKRPIDPCLLEERIKLHRQMDCIQSMLDVTADEDSLAFNTILEQAPIGIVLSYGDEPSCDTANDPAVINKAFEKITGRTRKELLEKGWANITHPEDRDKDVELFNDLLSGKNKGYSMEKRFIRPDGSVVWVDITVTPLKITNNTRYKHICLAQDITARKIAEDHLRESERSKSVLLSNLPGMAYRCSYDPNWTMQFVSAGCYELTGYKPENFINNRDVGLNDITLSEYNDRIIQDWKQAVENRQPFSMEYEIITASGEKKWVHETGQGVFDDDGNVVALEGIIIDITGRKEQELKLMYLSQHDPITGLYNRTYFKNMLSNIICCGEYANQALLLLNIKKINALSLTYGYSFSENTITELANKLSSVTNYNIKLFHISFERFVLYVSGFKRDFDLISLCHSVFDLMSSDPITNSLGCGIGIFKVNKRECDPETILKNLSAAAERADNESLFSYCFFDEKMEESLVRETEVKKELLSFSEENSNIYIEYQPLVCLETGKVSGFEALARMKSDKLGIVPPLEFIPLAEEMQIIVPMGIHIIKTSCEFLKDLAAAGFENVSVAVNVSAIQVLNFSFVQNVLDIVSETGVDPKNLTMEITESVFTDNFDLINLRLGKLQEIGISVSIDDFGTGYSSLSRESELNVDYIKIDKFFIDKLEILNLQEAITCDIISMAHKMGHRVVAEGVETEKQKQYLLDHKCDFMQGFLFSRPVNSASAIELLKKTNSARQ